MKPKLDVNKNVQNRPYSGPTKRTCFLQKLKKGILALNCSHCPPLSTIFCEFILKIKFKKKQSSSVTARHTTPSKTAPISTMGWGRRGVPHLGPYSCYVWIWPCCVHPHSVEAVYKLFMLQLLVMELYTVYKNWCICVNLFLGIKS